MVRTLQSWPFYASGTLACLSGSGEWAPARSPSADPYLNFDTLKKTL